MTWFTHYRTRRLEWSLATYTLFFGLALLLPWPSMASLSFLTVLGLMSETSWGLVYTAVGLCHMMSLHINGRAAWTPFARLAALFLNSQVFLALAVGLMPANPLGTGVLTYGFMAVGFCGPAMAAAAFDCGREYKIWRGRNV